MSISQLLLKGVLSCKWRLVWFAITHPLKPKEDQNMSYVKKVYYKTIFMPIVYPNRQLSILDHDVMVKKNVELACK